MSPTYTEVIFDIETKKIFEDIGSNDPAGLGVSIVSLYKRILDENFNEVDEVPETLKDRDISDRSRISGLIGRS